MKYQVGYFLPATEGIFSVIRDYLPADCELVTLGAGQSPLDGIRDLDFVIAAKVTREMVGAAPRLRLIMTPGVGSDGVDIAAACERGIPVAVTICGNSVEVAEHTVLLMLAVSRRLTELDAALRQGRWMMWERRLESSNLAGKCLGLIGFGRIGRAVAERLKGFAMKIVYSDKVSVPGYQQVELNSLLATSDYVSLHVPLTEETRRMLDSSRMQRMKRGSILINTSRGEIVEEAALIEALRSGHLAGAGLDVFEKEPPAATNSLLSMPNVVLTPHVASGTRDGLSIKARQYAENITRVLHHQMPIDCISPGAVNVGR